MSQPNTGVDPNRYAKILSRTPDLLRTLLGCFPDTVLEASYGAGTWSACEVMGCMIYEEQNLWLLCARRIIDGGEVLAPEFMDHNGHSAMFRGKTPSELVARFASLREANLAKLISMPLGPGDLARRGRHPVLGLVTLAEWLTTWMVHDLCHFANICKAIALPCSQEAGPWQTYLSILMAPIEKRGYS
jgi:DinB superfamily